MFDFLPLIDWIALGWFVFCWLGYHHYARIKSEKRLSLSSSLTKVRELWIARLLERDIRIADTNALSILQRNVAFFASTTVFILAGVLTVLGATDQAIALVNNLPYINFSSAAAWEFKLIVLLIIFIYAFFKFTWCIRQYNFSVIAISAAPTLDADEREKKIFIEETSKLLDLASNSFALGLRSYSYALATLAWFVQPWLFILSTTWVVAVLYRRDFHSRSLFVLKNLSSK